MADRGDAYVFISYSREDIDYLRRLVQFLEDNAVPTWYDEHISIGAQWRRMLASRIEDASALMLVDSPAAQNSRWVDEELQYAQRLGKTILPILVAGKPRFGLLGTQYEKVVREAMPGPRFLQLTQVLITDHRATWAGTPEPRDRRRPLLSWLRRTRSGAPEAREPGRLLLEPYSEFPPRWPAPWLLSAEFGVVPFIDEANRLRDLKKWCLSPSLLSICSIAGESGTGKSRLGRELCSRMRSQGWSAGPAATTSAVDWEEFVPQAPTIVIFDYAERAVDCVISIVNRMAFRQNGPPVRLLMVARKPTLWQDELRLGTNGLSKYLTDLHINLEGDVSATAGASHVAHAYDVFRRHLNLPMQSIKVEEAQVEGTPLVLHAAALLKLQGEDMDDDSTDDPAADTLRALLDREERIWLSLLSTRGVDLDRQEALRLIAAMSLVKPSGAFVGAVTDVVIGSALPGRHRNRVRRWLGDLSPGEAVDPLKTDLLVEELLDRTPDLADLVENLFLAVAPEDTDLLARFLERLALNSGRKRVLEALGSCLAGHLRELLHVVREPSSRALVLAVESALRACAGLQGVQDACLDQVWDLPEESVALISLSVTVAEVALPALERGTRENQERAVVVGTLASRLASAGRLAESLQYTRTAVAAARELTPSDSTRSEQILAANVGNLGHRLSAVGDVAGAYETSREAVSLYGSLNHRHAGRYLTELAASTSNMASYLAAQGRQREALEPAARAVEMYRTLYAGRGQAYLPELARSLHNYAYQLLVAYEVVAATEVAQESVQLYRHLAAEHDELAVPDLVRGLSNLAAMLSEQCLHAEALPLTLEAVERRRELAAAVPNRYEQGLAASLDNLGIQYRRLGRVELGTAAAREALTSYERLAGRYSQRFTSDVARVKGNLATLCALSGSTDEALAHAENSVELLEGLAHTNERYVADMVKATVNLGILLTATNRTSAAVLLLDKAISMRRSLHASDPELHTLPLHTEVRITDVCRSLAGVPALATEQDTALRLHQHSATSHAQCELRTVRMALGEPALELSLESFPGRGAPFCDIEGSSPFQLLRMSLCAAPALVTVPQPQPRQ
ncbi:toll/interleukin-1 receptor domain-containing protein [Micromonospora sp. NPDC047527]|uniref:tetratricopeptide repeat protein n=1 Tax=Micromonospora sp. NPDC047527 TaxID=3155144 RepID=UPI0033F05432